MYLKLTTLVMLSLIIPFAKSVWFAHLSPCNSNDVTRQVWTIVTETAITGTTELTTSLSLADGSLLALRDCDAYIGAQFLVGAGTGHCDQIIFLNETNAQTGSVTSTIKLASPQDNWCVGIGTNEVGNIGSGPGVGAYPWNKKGTEWIARKKDDSFTLELQEYPPSQRRCLSAREWGEDTHNST